MSEKPKMETIIENMSAQLIRTRQAEVMIHTDEGRTLLDGIREMQEEIKQGKKVMLEAVEFIEKGKEGDAWRIIVDLLAKHQPMDNGAGDADQKSSAISG